MDWYKDEHEMVYPDNREEWNRPGRIQLCKDCNLTKRIRAMEDMIIALEAVETKAEKDKDSSYVDQWALLPAEEMDAVWAALSAYRMVR
jgi:hypothetical protein